VEKLVLGDSTKDYRKVTYPVLLDGGQTSGLKIRVPGLVLKEDLKEGQRYTCAHLDSGKYVKVLNMIDNKLTELVGDTVNRDLQGVEFRPSVSSKGLMRLYLPHKSNKLKVAIYDSSRRLIKDSTTIGESTRIDVLLRLKYVNSYSGTYRPMWEVVQAGILENDTRGSTSTDDDDDEDIEQYKGVHDYEIVDCASDQDSEGEISD